MQLTTRAALTDPCGSPSSPAGGPSEAPPGRRLYTVSLPPGGCIPCPPEPPSRTTSENSSSSDDAGGNKSVRGGSQVSGIVN